MPGNTEGKCNIGELTNEKEKCLEKLNQMQKYLPFLDFMIDKIKKKNNEISLECQLSKFQLLRSMISEKNGKYNWDVIVKVEDVIEKLISKLDFKDQYEKSKEYSVKTDSENTKTRMASSLSISPSSSEIVSVPISSNSQAATVDVKPQDFSPTTVDLIMKTLKISTDNNINKSMYRGKELSSCMGSNHSLEVSGKTMETDLDKDLDGFDLTDCSNLSEADSSNAAVESVVNIVPEKVSSHEDLLSSSREKLLKSLQSRLFPGRTYCTPSQSSNSNKNEKVGESQNISAFSRSKTNPFECKAKGEFLGSIEQNVRDKNNAKDTPIKGYGKNFSINLNLVKPVSLLEKARDESSNLSDFNLKQKLKEKLSTDICEVYRVPGKSVGGSLRSLKESKSLKKTFIVEEDELFKPDKVVEKGSSERCIIPQSISTTGKKGSQIDKCHRDSSGSSNEKTEKCSEKTCHKHSSSNSGKNEKNLKKSDYKNSNSSENRSNKNEFNKDIKTEEKVLESKNPIDSKVIFSKEVESKSFELDKVSDEELLEFVKENMQSLPYLAKLKPAELRKAVQSSLLKNFVVFDADDVSEISDDSLQDLDDVIISENKKSEHLKLKTCPNSRIKVKDKTEKQEIQPSVSFKKAQVDCNNGSKNLKQISEQSDDAEHLEVRAKNHDLDDISIDENMDEEDYAVKLIEETTPKTYPPKKKGLLELPMPITDDLFDDISSIESFETLASPPDVRDPRLAKLYLSVTEDKNKSKSKLESNSQLSPSSSKIAKEFPSTSSMCANPMPSKENNNHGSKSQNFGPHCASTDSFKGQRSNLERSDVWAFKAISSHGPQDVNQFSQFNNSYFNESNDSKFRHFGKASINSYNKYPRRHIHSSSEPKSYAEYKRRKLEEQEKISQREQPSKESPKNILSDGSNVPETSRSSAEKEDVDRNIAKKVFDLRHSGSKDSFGKNYNPIRTYEARKSLHSKQRRHSDHVDSRQREDFRERTDNRKEEVDKMRKDKDEKPHSLESEELISPLEELYRSGSKPKTGRGYGIQNFKIPKKVRDIVSQEALKTKASNFSTSFNNTIGQTGQGEVDSTKENVELTSDQMKETQVNVVDYGKVQSCDSSQVDITSAKEVLSKGEGKTESNTNCTNASSNIIKSKSGSVELSDPSGETSSSKTKNESQSSVSEPVAIPEQNNNKAKLDMPGNDESKAGLSNNMPDVKQQISCMGNVTEERSTTITEPKQVSENVSKCEAQVVECDSSVESSLNDKSCSVKETVTLNDKSSVVSKEEITQEFVEALIRKSFQSGEGKLLLAQVKLFEEFARKLNSKKLKTIQKIINSESDSTSSSSETSSEEEKKKKKNKKLEEKNQKSKKRKKRGKSKRKKKTLSSSSSSSESEETTEEENCVKKEGRSSQKNDEAAESEESKALDSPTTSEELKSKGNEFSSVVKTKNKKRRRNLEFGRNFSGRKAKRKQKQKLLEQILNETPQPEANDSNAENSLCTLPKEPEPKSRPKPKAKVKTELDRLHDDIRSMFISEGVVTATGQRMCRILKQTGGNMNNVDIVKESAKMVEEEKLKKVQTRTSLRYFRNANSGNSGNRSRSQSLDKGTKTTRESPPENEDEQDAKLKLEPRITLQRVDLDNFGYGIKISDDCISFRRMQGRNTALRGVGSFGMPHSEKSKNNSNSSVAKNVFLARNKRKFEQLRNSKYKKSYTGKKLIDIVKNLPLKMAKMKHLQIYEENVENELTKKKRSTSEKYSKKNTPQKLNIPKIELSNMELLHYAFEKKRRVYPCKLCTHVTKNIAGHYRTVHPNHEVLISRLCFEEAKKAKLDSKRNGYDLKTADNVSSAEPMKTKVNELLRRTSTYNCRMCCSSRIADINTFAAHVSAHTGEFRFQCPAEGCVVQLFSREDIKFHILTKHVKSRYELYNKISERYSLTIEGGTLFGFLCSKCHFVQVCLSNLKDHIARQHSASEKVKVIKINMSSKKWRRIKKKSENPKNINKDVSVGFENIEKKEEVNEEAFGVDNSELDISTTKENSINSEKNLKKENRKRKLQLENGSSDIESQNGKNLEQDIEVSECKKIFIDENAVVEEVKKKQTEIKSNEELIDPLGEEEIDVEENEGGEDIFCNNLDLEDCVDLKNISTLKGSDIIESMENHEKLEFGVKSKPETLGSFGKLKVGPLEAQILENSEVLYECYVKGCLFFTRVFDLFEKHIKISHWKTKWNGICGICGNGKDGKSQGQDNLKLLTALQHLKLHEKERCKGGKLTTEDLIIELKLLNSTNKFLVDDEESDKCEAEAKHTKKGKEQNKTQEKFENFETPYPTKPLLRVRNLLGDRLSTPKADENDVVAMSEEEAKVEESLDSSMMFTIENVRSLTDAPSEESEIKIEEVCSLKDQLPKSVNQLGSGKTIIVRSCPTRKIAIRPEPSPLPVDAGHINVVQPSVVGHPVVLGPISSTSPIRIISAALTPKSKFSVKPIVVSGDSVTLNSPTVMPVLCPALSPALSPAVAATTILPVTSTSETNKLVHKENNPEETQPLLDVEIIASPTRSKSPSMPSLTIHHLPKSSSDVEETDEKDTITPQRIHSNPNIRKKSLKDAKVYQEMLTKTKLCHLFKCMGIECSFTCNDENVFTQHIGLHNAQRRLKRAKGMKTIYLRLANKTTRAFYWQQCAYCCEVMSNTNNALSQHVLEEHGHCMYQCAFCFYRAVSHSYVEIHQNLAHSQVLKTTPRVIYKCKPLKVPPSPTVLLEKHGRRQSVRPYHCDQCGRKFFITQEFTNHLASEHQSVTAYTCHICKNLCFKVNRLINHYKLHSYCTYQCAYCLHGTETEKEMVFHLCNFHFSQPAVMYVRAVAEGQTDDIKQKASKKKKPLSNQLDALKVIVYESDTLNLDCIVEANLEEGTENGSEASLDLSAIVAELGINTDSQSSTNVTPIMQELASIGDKSGKSLTVKTLLPNAEFSSENENGNENCSVLISSGLSVPSDQNDDREMNIPLGQLPLEAVNVQHKETAPPSSLPNKVEPADKNLKLSEILVNLQQKDKTLALPSPEEEKIGQSPNVSSAVHKLPPVVLSRNSTSKISYSSKSALKRKKSVEQFPNSESNEGDKGYQQLSCGSKERTEETGGSSEKIVSTPLRDSSLKVLNLPSRKPSPEKDGDPKISNTSEPLITNVISLSSREFGKEKSVEISDTSTVISDTNSSIGKVKDTKGNSSSSGVVINIQSKLNCPSVLEPPIIKVEDFPIDEVTITPALSKERTPNVIFKETNKETNGELKDTKDELPTSPDIIILEEEKIKDIVTVILDSDDEKDENVKKVNSGYQKKVENYSENPKENRSNLEMSTELEDNSKDPKDASTPFAKDDTIRKEMELLRKQMTNETDSLLLEESESVKSAHGLTLNVKPPSESGQGSDTKTLLSPIEEAICSLNKKLQSETEEAQKKEVEKKMNVEEESSPKSNDSESKIPDRPRTRFGARDKRREGVGNSEKNDGDDSLIKKEDPGKSKKFKEELVGKELFICGNEKCTFAADDDSSLKDHLYICDLSRESSVLVCPHCSRQIKQFHPYLEHLRYHGEKKFHCGLCSFSSAVDASVSRHLKQKHKCSLTKTLPKGSKEGHLVYYPKNYKVEKIDFEVNGYSPGDEDKLPLQSVYQVNVKCAKCPYFTKVRSNMVRHLKIHVKSVETEGVVVVPSTAPTNPVPCLETKERMFDKMTNLAASSQLAQAKEKTAIESLSPEEEAKLPQFVAEQMRYKCCLPDCNYLTIDDGMLKHHIKALHDEINYYSCPHCKSTVHVDVRHVTLDKIGHHLKHHDAKLYKCGHCIYFHYQKNVVEKHTIEKHPDRRYFVHTVREPKPDFAGDEEPSSSEGEARVWKCGLCSEFKTLSKPFLMDHLLKSHNTKSKYKCQFCSMKGNSYQAFLNHFSSRHAGEKVSYLRVYYSEKVASNSLESQSGNSSGADSSNEHFDTTPLWQRGAPRVRHIRGILIEEEEIKTKKSKRTSLDDSETETSEAIHVKENVFCCPLCTNKKKPFYTRNEHCFRTHLYQELNYQQFACILCGKMFVDKKDFEKHHTRVHSDKPQALKQTKEDHEIKFWVDQVIAKRKKQMEERKRKLSDAEENEKSQGPPKKKKEV